jgi:hypothetical protein
VDEFVQSLYDLGGHYQQILLGSKYFVFLECCNQISWLSVYHLQLIFGGARFESQPRLAIQTAVSHG